MTPLENQLIGLLVWLASLLMLLAAAWYTDHRRLVRRSRLARLSALSALGQLRHQNRKSVQLPFVFGNKEQK